MFNWFRRQKVQPEQEQAPPAPVEETPSEATSQEEYLDWAKKAFKNIQEKKATAEAVVSETPETSIAETEPLQEEEPVKEEETEDNTPAWLKKSDRLEILKETAIETPTEPDEDFIWSAKVLANQGRQAEDVSEEEITWLKKLRQGLGKTRRSLVN